MTDAKKIRQGVVDALPSDVVELLPLGDARAAGPSVLAELTRFLDLMRDYPNRPGKTLRGRLLLLSSQAHGAAGGSGAASARTLAEALELFQNWVLVHDDIEDGSEERRGQPALHRLTGMPLALNVGDAMHVAMWQHLHGLPQDAPFRAAALTEFGRMIMRTAAGQHLDLAWVQARRFDVTQADYLTMVSLKTAYYTVIAPLRLGAICASVTPSSLLEAAGLELGVAFQIRDDVLNLTPGAELGKEFAGDLYEGKRTLMLAHLLAQAPAAERAQVIRLLDQPRHQKQPAEMEQVLQLMQRHGSVEYAQEYAERRLQRGIQLLDEALAPLPNHAAVAAIHALVAELAARAS